RLTRGLEYLEDPKHRHRVGQIERWARRRPQIERLSGKARSEQVLGLDDADNLLRTALHDWKARIRTFANLTPVFLFRIVQLEPCYLRPRRHHRARSAIAEPQRHLDDRRLGVRDVPGRRTLAQHEVDLFVGNGRRSLAAQWQQPEHEIGRSAQEAFHGGSHTRYRPHEPG